MEKIIGAFSTNVKLTGDEAKELCKMGQGDECCAFLVCGAKGFECIRLDYPNNLQIFDRLEKGTMNAKGKGGWVGCALEKELANEKS
jgi:hypothetical protein